jgi:hypothetical protein
MKFFTAILLIFAAAQVQADTEPATLVITEVAVETPLPTGLESAAFDPATGNELITLMFTDPKVKPLMDTVYEQNKELIADAIDIGGAFYQQGSATINCNEPMILFFREDDRYCKFEANKSFGWYADIQLGIKVSGYVLKTAIPNTVNSTEGYYFIN